MSRIVNYQPVITKDMGLIENRTPNFVGGSAVTSPTNYGIWTTVINITSPCIILGMSFLLLYNSYYMIKITVDGVVYTMNQVAGTLSTGTPVNFPFILKCNSSFKVEIEMVTAGTSEPYNYYVSYVI